MPSKKSTNTSRTRVTKTASGKSVKVSSGDNLKVANKLTEKEMMARKMRKYATTTFGHNTRVAYSGAETIGSQFGNFYSPQLSTDFLEKPQNLRERRAWYRHFYNANEFVGQSIDLHSTLPLSKIRLEKPEGKNEDMIDYMYSYFHEMCEEMKLFKALMEISHEYWLLGNAFIFAEDHEPYKIEDESDEEKVRQLKEYGSIESKRLFEEFQIIDKDPNYKGWRKLIVLPPDQVRIKKIPLSDESMLEFIPDPETRKSILRSQDPSYQNMPEEGFGDVPVPEVPNKLISALKENGSIPLDTDPYSGSHCYHMARKKSQYETLGVSILERCVNTLLLQDKLRQAQTSIASRHMTPIRIVWAEELSEADVENLREQVDLALVDPDFSIITNFQVNWEEMGSNGRLLELSTEYDHIENSLFAGLGVTREILTGEGTYAGNRITLEIMNTQYLLFRELLQEYVENYLFKPVAKKKGFVEKDKYGREKLLYPKLSFNRLAIRDNDAYFDQVMQLYQKGSVSVDIILDMLNIDPISTRKKIEADMFTVNDPNFTNLMVQLYTASGTALPERYNVNERIAHYMDLEEVEQPEGAEGAGGLEGAGAGAETPRFASVNSPKKLTATQKAGLDAIMKVAMKNPEKLDRILDYLAKR